MDALTRRKRMQGYEAPWPPGMDHAGIATQTVVEKQLAVDGKTKEDFGRDCSSTSLDWKHESGGTIGGQMRRLGDGVDWSRDRFTMDEGLSRAVRTIFKRLYDAGLIYGPSAWSTGRRCCRPRSSDLEVSYVDVEGELVSFRYGSLDDADAHRRGHHPGGDDARRHRDRGAPRRRAYRSWSADAAASRFSIGSWSSSPTSTSTLNSAPARSRSPRPTIPTTSRSGCATTCRCRTSWTPGPGSRTPERFRRHGPLRGAREGARSAGRAGPHLEEKRPYLHSVGHSERSGEPIEPRLSLQWWVKVARWPRPPATRFATATP